MSLEISKFNSLNIAEKKEFYRQANITHNFGLVKLLNQLGMKPNASIPPSPAIVSTSMDINTKYNIILGFLKDLRKNNRLFNEKEFNDLSDKYQWINKGDKLSRIQGSKFLDNKIHELHLKYMKVPKKIAVIKDGDVVTVSGKKRSEKFYDFKSPEIEIYAKRISKENRKMTRDEIDEFIKLIEVSDFCDLNLSNIFLAQDGIYFIDTEFKSFNEPIQWEKVQRFEAYINQEDINYFRNLIKDKKDQDKDWKYDIAHSQSINYLKRELRMYEKWEPESTAIIEGLKAEINNLEYVGTDAFGYGGEPNTFNINMNEILQD